MKNAGCALSTTNEIYCNLAPRKRACLASVPVADEAAGGGERTMVGDCSAEGGTREGRVRGTLGRVNSNYKRSFGPTALPPNNNTPEPAAGLRLHRATSTSERRASGNGTVHHAALTLVLTLTLSVLTLVLTLTLSLTLIPNQVHREAAARRRGGSDHVPGARATARLGAGVARRGSSITSTMKL